MTDQHNPPEVEYVAKSFWSYVPRDNSFFDDPAVMAATWMNERAAEGFRRDTYVGDARTVHVVMVRQSGEGQGARDE